MTLTKLNIPHPTADEIKAADIAFMNAYGKSFRKMRKEELAQMVINQSVNIVKFKNENMSLMKIGMAMYRQRNWYLKLIRRERNNDKK